MADLMTALRNADAAGDAAAAKRLAELIRQQAATQQQPQSAPDDSVFTGMANSALRIAGGATDFLPTVTKAITGHENPAIYVPGKEDGFLGVDWANIGDTQFMDSSDPRLKGAENPFGFEGNEFEKAADAIYAKQKSLNYQPKVPWEQVKADPSAGNVLTFMGEAAVTSLPDMAAAMLSTPAYFASYVAPIAQKRAENDGRTEVTPADLSYAAVASLGIAQAEKLGAKGIFTKGAGNIVTRPLKAGAKEAATEGIQNPLQYAAETAGTKTGFDTAEAMDQAAAGIVGGAGAGTGIRGTLDVVGAVTPGGNNEATDPDAAAELANRLGGIVQANNLNLSDLEKGSTKGARQAVDLAHVQIASEMKQLLTDLKTRLKVDRLDPLDTVVDKVNAEAASREARTKTKSIVGQQEFDATERLVGDTQEGQRLLALYRQSNELTNLHNSGYVGGLSKYTDQLSPFASNVGYTARSAAELPTRLLATGAGATLNPAIPAAQLAAVGTGRAVDAVTGRRSRVRKYLRDNAGQGGIEIDPTLQSLREEAIKADEQKRTEEQALRELMLERDNPPKGLDPTDPRPSPEAVMWRATGLENRQEIDQILDKIKREVPQLRSAVESYRKSLREGGEVNNLSYLIQEVKGQIRKNPAKYPASANAISAIPSPAERPGYVRGIESNRQVLAQIIREAENDQNLFMGDRTTTLNALSAMRDNLGSNPTETIEQIIKDADQMALDKPRVRSYLDRYADRIKQQQKQAAEKASSKKPKRRFYGLPEDTEDDIDLFTDLRFPEDTAPKRTHREIGEELEAQQKQRYNRDLNPYKDQADFDTVADAMTEEARLQFDKMPDAATWYDDDIKLALARTAEILPEINESGNNRQLFLLLAALTSVGHKPRINWRYAGALAMHYYRSGEIGEIAPVFSEKRGKDEERLVNPASGQLFGLKAASIEPGLKILRHMINTYGLNDTLEWINSDKTKAEIDAMRKEAGFGPQGKIKGGMNAVVPAIQMFGPKVGPFYMNLNGIHEVTVDLWASRTVRRHTGGLLDPLYKPGEKRNAADTGLIDAPTEVERPTMKALFTRVGENLGVTPQAAQAILWAYEQELYNDLGAKLIYEKFSEGADLFREKEAVAYEARKPGLAAGQNRSRKVDDGSQSAIEQSRQLSLDFDQQRSDSGLRPQAPAVGSRPARPEEIRDIKPTIDAVFEIGKPGSPFENGVPDVATAKKIARAINIALIVAKNQKELAQIFGKRSLGDGFSYGAYRPYGDPTVRSSAGHRGLIGVMGEYKSPKNKVTPLQSLWAALHELGHGIESGFIPGNEPKSLKRRMFYQRLSDGKLTEPKSKVYGNTFREVIVNLMEAAKTDGGARGYTQQDAQEILDEIVRMQRGGVLSGLGEANVPVRPSYDDFNSAIAEQERRGNFPAALDFESQLLQNEDTYFQTPQELAADLIGVYLIDPKYAKMMMPKATKLVRDVMNNGGPVKFFSMPLASIVAAIFANMLVAAGEEEERKGILARQTI